MGTRADFYIGTGKDAEWLGSVALDGYRWEEEPDNLLILSPDATTFRTVVTGILKDRHDATLPEQGWPWPWNDSKTTDYAYAFKDGKVQIFNFESPEDGWPDMSERKKVALGNRSGLFIIQKTKDGLEII